MRDRVRIWGPASLSNLGPGFDTLGVALSGVGDIVEVASSPTPGVQVLPGGGVWEAPRDPNLNTAARAAAWILTQVDGPVTGLSIRIFKGLRPGSGLGSSAASAAAAALGALMVCSDHPRESAVEAALAGESVVSGARHGDNVLPALLGGAVLSSAEDPSRFRRLRLKHSLHFAVVRPHVPVLTKQARAMLPQQVPLRDAVLNASWLAFLVDALISGDAEAVGEAVEKDRIVEPVRAALVPGYSEILSAAREAGAYGAALSGSGPAMFAVCRDREHAAAVREAMEIATRTAGSDVSGFEADIDEAGARCTDLEVPGRWV